MIATMRIDIEDVKPVFDVLKEIVQDVNLSFTKKRLEIYATDAEKNSLMFVTFDHTTSYSTTSEDPIYVGVYAPILFKAMRAGKTGDELEFKVDNNNSLTVNVFSSGYLRTTSKFPSIMMPVEVFDMTSNGTHIGLNARSLWMACRDISSINKIATLHTPSLSLTTTHPMGEFKADLTAIMDDPVPVMANNSASFYVKTLMRLCKMKGVDTIALNVSDLSPLQINFSHRCGVLMARIATVNDYTPDVL